MQPIYKDKTKPVTERVADLLSRMTLEEKFTQMRLLSTPSHFWPDFKFDPEKLKGIDFRLGSLYINDSAPAQFVNDFQNYFLNNTRLGIPVSIHGEGLHGAMNVNATVFTNPLGLGATFNPDIVSEMAGIVGREVRANGITAVYAPNLDLSREPRWGRVEEDYGEDPYLVSRMGIAYIKAMQAQGVASCPKHYIAHGTPERGINVAPVHAGERELRDTYALPFKKAFMEAKAMSVMPAYSELDGIPVHASYFLMTELLRGEYGFEGPAISDWNAISMLHHTHFIAETPEDAGMMALKAGIDVEAPDYYAFTEKFMDRFRNGEAPMELVDTAVSRVLAFKFKLGLFENPYALVDKSGVVHTASNREAAKRAETEAAVLLKNEGLLPLAAKPGKVAVIGPNSDTASLGDYVLRQSAAYASTVLGEMKKRLGEENVIAARGTNIAFEFENGIEDAVNAAKKADFAVVVLGDNSSYYENEYWSDREDPAVRRNSVICGETFDTCDLNLPPVQQKLLEAVYATGTPVVLVLQSGRPHSIVWAKEHIPAILETWYPGECGGEAICDLLFGIVNPSGRLPITCPRSVGHLPCFYNHKPSSTGKNCEPGSPEQPGRMYVFDSPKPLWDFGYGLSYTKFEYSDLTVTPDTISAYGSVEVSVTVKNTGDRKGKDSVLLFLRDKVCRITPFVRRLRGFKKIELLPGESKKVTFTLASEDFEFINEHMKPEIEPGLFEVYVGDLKAQFRIK